MHKIFFYKKASGREVISEFIDSFPNEAIIKIRTDKDCLKNLVLVSLLEFGVLKGAKHFIP